MLFVVLFGLNSIFNYYVALCLGFTFWSFTLIV